MASGKVNSMDPWVVLSPGKVQTTDVFNILSKIAVNGRICPTQLVKALS